MRVGKVAENVREALGDSTAIGGVSGETFTATSLEAVRAYTLAQDLSMNPRDTEAVVQYREALRHDSEFGRAYSGLAASLLPARSPRRGAEEPGRGAEAHRSHDRA